MTSSSPNPTLCPDCEEPACDPECYKALLTEINRRHAALCATCRHDEEGDCPRDWTPDERDGESTCSEFWTPPEQVQTYSWVPYGDTWVRMPD